MVAGRSVILTSAEVLFVKTLRSYIRIFGAMDVIITEVPRVALYHRTGGPVQSRYQF